MDLTQLTKRIEELEKTVESLKSSTTIQFEIGGAMKERVLSGTIGTSNLTANSKTLSASVGLSVAAPMTGFIVLNLNGIPYNIPYYV
jgi:hypothetical protein